MGLDRGWEMGPGETPVVDFCGEIKAVGEGWEGCGMSKGKASNPLTIETQPRTPKKLQKK